MSVRSCKRRHFSSASRRLSAPERSEGAEVFKKNTFVTRRIKWAHSDKLTLIIPLNNKLVFPYGSYLEENPCGPNLLLRCTMAFAVAGPRPATLRRTCTGARFRSTPTKLTLSTITCKREKGVQLLVVDNFNQGGLSSFYSLQKVSSLTSVIIVNLINRRKTVCLFLQSTENMAYGVPGTSRVVLES